MEKISQHISDSDHLSEVIAYLKNADTFIHRGDLTHAMEEIMHARDKHPSIMYTRAYEEYVRSMIQKVKFIEEDASQPAGSALSIVNEYIPTLEKILDLAIKEIKRNAVTAFKQKEMAALQRQREMDLRKDEEMRTEGLRRKITSYIHRARELQKKNDFHNALNEVARAFMLDPADERILEIEEQIKDLKVRFEQQEEQENIRKQMEAQEHRQRLFEEWQTFRQKEREIQQNQDEERYRHARSQKIREYLQDVRSFFASGRYNDALTQLAFVLVLDPLNEEVLSLNWKIREEQVQRGNEQIDQKKKRIAEDQRKKNALLSSIQNHIQKAEQYAAEKNFSESLRFITQAYFLDPTNEEVAAAERKILAAEESEADYLEEERKRMEVERRHRQEAELHRLAIEQQKREKLKEKIEFESKLLKEREEVLLFLSKARGFFSQGKYDVALSNVASAFKINPFDDEIVKLRQEIFAVQHHSKVNAHVPSSGKPLAGETGAVQRGQEIDSHIMKAKSLRQKMFFKEALDEIAQAYLVDPLNEDLFALEAEIQQEFLRYEEEQTKHKESTEQSSAIRKSIATARDCFAREAFGEALAWIDYALSFDMQHHETLQLKEEVEQLQHIRDDKRQRDDKELTIQTHLSRANEFTAQNKYFEAILETDLALRLNAKHPGAVLMRSRLQHFFKQSNDGSV